MTKDATLDIHEIASAPLGKKNLLTMWSARVGGEVRLELTSMKIVKGGLERPPRPLPLSPASLDAAIKLVDQGEAMIASGVPLVFKDHLALLGQDGELVLCVYGTKAGPDHARGRGGDRRGLRSSPTRVRPVAW